MKRRTLWPLMLLGIAGCTLLRDYDQLHAGATDAGVPGHDDANDANDANDDGDARLPRTALGCGEATCDAATQVCCVKFADQKVSGRCIERASDAAAACAAVTEPSRLAGVLECDTSAQCLDGSVCCGDGTARLDNDTVYLAQCRFGPQCPASANELCGPGRAGPGLLAACRNGAAGCERTHDLDVTDDASEDDASFPLLKCSL